MINPVGEVPEERENVATHRYQASTIQAPLSSLHQICFDLCCGIADPNLARDPTYNRANTSFLEKKIVIKNMFFNKIIFYVIYD